MPKGSWLISWMCNFWGLCLAARNPHPRWLIKLHPRHQKSNANERTQMSLAIKSRDWDMSASMSTQLMEANQPIQSINWALAQFNNRPAKVVHSAISPQFKLRLKTEASGWPAGCDTEADKQAHLQQWLEREGIQLDAHNILTNPGLRHIAKMLLNALYGKMAQRPESEEVRYTSTPAEFHHLLADSKRELVDFTHLNEHLDRVQLRKKAEFAKGPTTNALQIAACVTSHSRLILYDYLCEILANGGQLLYCDTDSAIHVRRRGGAPCCAEGDWLGQMKRELGHRHIKEFWCAGPKNYVLLHQCAQTGGDVRADMKVRGIELTHEAQQMMTYRRIRRLIRRHFGRDEHALEQGRRQIVVPQRQFHRNRRSEIYTRRTQKIYKPVYSKGIVLADFHTRPFGWFVASQQHVDGTSDSSDDEEDDPLDSDVDQASVDDNGNESEAEDDAIELEIH